MLGWSKIHSAQSPAVQPDGSAECHMQALHELMRVSVNVDLAYIMITCSASHSPVYTACAAAIQFAYASVCNSIHCCVCCLGSDLLQN